MEEEIKKFYDYLGIDYNISLNDFREFKKQKLQEQKKQNADFDVEYFKSACNYVEKHIIEANCNNKGFFDLQVSLNNILTLIMVLVAVAFATGIILIKLL